MVRDMKRRKYIYLQRGRSHVESARMFYTYCVGHSYLPEAMMKTIVVTIVNNRTGDLSSINNYRQISLATIVATVWNGVNDIQLRQNLQVLVYLLTTEHHFSVWI